MPAPGSTDLWELIEARARQTPDRRMVVDDLGRSLTFGQYRDAVAATAAGFVELGVGDGTPVSWVLPTWIESLVLAGALARLGAVQNPILPIYREREVGFCTRQTGARLLVVPGTWRGFDYRAMAEGIAAGRDDLAVVVVGRSTDALPSGDPAGLPPAPASTPTTDRWRFYTSGTTADPKGVRHSHATIAASARGVGASVEIGPDDEMGVVFPYTHVGGIALLFGALQDGFGQILVESFDPATSIAALAEHGVTVAGAGTVFWTAYLAAQAAAPDRPLFPRLRALVGGGSTKPAGLHDRVRLELGGRGIVSGYGLTECPSAVLCSIRDDDAALDATDGRPAEGVELRLVAADGTVGAGGEVQLRGPMAGLGYVDATLDAATFGADGWIRTGDLGAVDERGHLRITGRLKDLIIRKGENVSAREVEEVLLGHPAVADVAVVGLPDATRGELACAVVVPAPGADAPDLAELGRHAAAAGLAVYKRPERLEIVERLPYNPTGKVLKHELRARYAPAPRSGVGPVADDPQP